MFASVETKVELIIIYQINSSPKTKTSELIKRTVYIYYADLPITSYRNRTLRMNIEPLLRLNMTHRLVIIRSWKVKGCLCRSHVREARCVTKFVKMQSIRTLKPVCARVFKWGLWTRQINQACERVYSVTWACGVVKSRLRDFSPSKTCMSLLTSQHIWNWESM